MKIPGPTHGSNTFSFTAISPNLETIYSAVKVGLKTTPKSFLLKLFILNHVILIYIIRDIQLF